MNVRAGCSKPGRMTEPDTETLDTRPQDAGLAGPLSVCPSVEGPWCSALDETVAARQRMLPASGADRPRLDGRYLALGSTPFCVAMSEYQLVDMPGGRFSVPIASGRGLVYTANRSDLLSRVLPQRQAEVKSPCICGTESAGAGGAVG